MLATLFGTLIAQAVVGSRRPALRRAVVAASGVLANFSGAPLAFAFVATLGTTGTLTRLLSLDRTGFSLYTTAGLVAGLPLLHDPADGGDRAARARRAAHPVAGGRRLLRRHPRPVLAAHRHPRAAPSLLGGAVLLFGTAFASHATAAVMVGSSVPLITVQISNALAGNVLVGQENLALAMSLNMVVIALLVMAV